MPSSCFAANEAVYPKMLIRDYIAETLKELQIMIIFQSPVPHGTGDLIGAIPHFV